MTEYTASQVEKYDAWYHSERGRWIGEQEISVLLKLLPYQTGQSLLDIGSGSGYFSRQFHSAGLNVTGIDSSYEMSAYACAKDKSVKYLTGNAIKLPFADNSFDYCSAITSLSFVAEPEVALAEMWRVSRKAVIAGLLNRNSLLYYRKRNSRGYKGARWDDIKTIRQWVKILNPSVKLRYCSVIWLPDGGIFARVIEHVAPKQLPYAGFLAVILEK